jgi:hypothetical protein
VQTGDVGFEDDFRQIFVERMFDAIDIAAPRAHG